MAAKVSEKCVSAIFIIDPENQSFILQSEKSNEFKDSIPMNSATIKKYIKKNKKFHQKDHPETWNELFHSQSWTGGECAIFNPSYIQNNLRSANPPPGATEQYVGGDRLGNNYAPMPGTYWFNPVDRLGQFQIKSTNKPPPNK